MDLLDLPPELLTLIISQESLLILAFRLVSTYFRDLLGIPFVKAFGYRPLQKKEILSYIVENSDQIETIGCFCNPLAHYRNTSMLKTSYIFSNHNNRLTTKAIAKTYFAVSLHRDNVEEHPFYIPVARQDHSKMFLFYNNKSPSSGSWSYQSADSQTLCEHFGGVDFSQYEIDLLLQREVLKRRPFIKYQPSYPDRFIVYRLSMMCQGQDDSRNRGVDIVELLLLHSYLEFNLQIMGILPSSKHYDLRIPLIRKDNRQVIDTETITDKEKQAINDIRSDNRVYHLLLQSWLHQER